ncbi:MAG: hypothetical protein K2P57_10195 [Burkholderiales bacterium]|nr:hypothetical protein [Burkholderiales bacterium]
MAKPSNSDQKESAASDFESEVLRRMLTTAPKLHEDKKPSAKKEKSAKQK